MYEGKYIYFNLYLYTIKITHPLLWTTEGWGITLFTTNWECALDSLIKTSELKVHSELLKVYGAGSRSISCPAHTFHLVKAMHSSISMFWISLIPLSEMSSLLTGILCMISFRVSIRNDMLQWEVKTIHGSLEDHSKLTRQ